MVAWARYLRQVDVQWCPLTAGPTPAAWLTLISSRKILDVVPKLKITHKLLTRPVSASDKPAELTSLTFADGVEEVLDLSKRQVKDIYSHIELSNLRVAAAEAQTKAAAASCYGPMRADGATTPP